MDDEDSQRSGSIVWSPKCEKARPELRSRISLPALSAEDFRMQRAGDVSYKVFVDAGYLAYHNLVRADGETIVSDSIRSTAKDVRNKLTFLPPGSSVEGWTRILTGEPSVLAVHLRSLPNEQREFDIAGLPPVLYFDDPNLRNTLLKIRSAIRGESFNDAVYLETLGLVLRLEIRRSFADYRPNNPARGGLPPHKMSQLLQYIQAHIASDLSLTDLSRIAGLSRSYFVRAFKQTVGKSPYQFVQEERVRHAKSFIKNNSDMTFEQIAHLAGFSSSLQLNRAFHKYEGRSPAVFKRDIE